MMEEQKNIDFDRESSTLSIKLSIILSTIYASAGTLVLFLRRDELIHFPLALILGSPFMALIIIYPSVILGYLTGRIITSIAKFSSIKRVSTEVFATISMFICFAIVLLIHMVFRIKIDLSFETLASYPLMFGTPSVIYIFDLLHKCSRRSPRRRGRRLERDKNVTFARSLLAGGWFGWKIYSKIINS